MNFLDNFSTPDVLPQRSYTSGKGGGGHIYLELLSSFREELSRDEYMELYYFHCLCEKSINHWRNREFNSGLVTFNQALEIDRDRFPVVVHNGVETIFLACSAYLDYAEKRFELAEEKVKNAMKISLKQTERMPGFVKIMYEHALNLLRIYIRTKDFDKITAYLTLLLNSLFFDEIDTDVLCDKLAAQTEDERENWLHYILNNVIYSIQRTYKDDLEKGAEIYLKVLESVFQERDISHSYCKPVQVSLKLILAFMTDDEAAYIDLGCNHFDEIAESPNFVRKLILSNHIYWAQSHGDDITIHPNFENFKSIAGWYGLDVNADSLLRQAV
jgi:tetratricopeptide (TPR) repeat protein